MADLQGAVNSILDAGEVWKYDQPLALRTVTAPVYVDNPQPDKHHDINYIINACIDNSTAVPCLRIAVV